MNESILGLKISVIARTVQVLSILAGVIVFLVFFALAPLHALILSGFVVMLASLFFKLETNLQKTGLYLGVSLVALGFAGITIPAVARGLSLLSDGLEQLMLFQGG